jgi:hypothetical protein
MRRIVSKNDMGVYNMNVLKDLNIIVWGGISSFILGFIVLTIIQKIVFVFFPSF